MVGSVRVSHVNVSFVVVGQMKPQEETGDPRRTRTCIRLLTTGLIALFTTVGAAAASIFQTARTASYVTLSNNLFKAV